MGYKMSLTPRASLQDGLLDLVIVPELSNFKLFLFTILFLFKKHHWMKEVRFKQITSLEIKSVNDIILKTQKDGEFFAPKQLNIAIEIHSKNLTVLVS